MAIHAHTNANMTFGFAFFTRTVLHGGSHAGPRFSGPHPTRGLRVSSRNGAPSQCLETRNGSPSV